MNLLSRRGITCALLLTFLIIGGKTAMSNERPSAVPEPIGIDALFDLNRLPVMRSSECRLISSYSRDHWNCDWRPEFLRIENADRRGKGLVFYTWAEGERVDDLLAEAQCEAGKWRHVAVTWALSTDRKLTKTIYVDGKQAGQRIVDNWEPARHRAAFPRESDDLLYIGSQVGRDWLTGALSDVYLYDHALSESAISDLASRKTGPTDGLLLHLPDEAAFRQGANRTLKGSGGLSPEQGTFAAWVNPSELTEGQMQHLFCLGADSMGLYLAPQTSGGEGVLADLKGPGCIYRIWLGGYGNRMLHLYFDGEKSPRVSLRFSGQHGEPDFGEAKWLPLTSGAGNLCYPPMMATGIANAPYLETGICYMPMPFAKSCRITLEPAGDKYLQVNYHLYPQDTHVTTFDPKRISSDTLAKCRAGREQWWNPAPCKPSGKTTADENTTRMQLAAGQSSEVYRTKGAGRVTGLWVKLPENLRTAEVLRGLKLRIYWDGEKHPAVDTPLGPFFNDAWGTPSEAKPVPLSPDIKGAVPNEKEWAQWNFGLPKEYRGLLFGHTQDRGYYCYFPMPYAKGARIELENTTSTQVPLTFMVRDETWPSVPANLGRFHAAYNRENPTQGIEDPAKVHADFTGKDNYVMLNTTGRGHFVGCSFFMRKVKPIKPEVERLVGEICEGNEMIFVDDDPSLTMIGTGSEDYLNQNYWVHDHIYPYDGTRISYDTCYRLHVSDVVPFKKNIRVTIEHGAANAHYIDYSSVAYWYQESPGAK